MVFPPQRPQTAIPEAIPEDQNIIQREAQKIRARELLNQLAQKIGGAGTRVRDANLFTQFLSQMDRQAKAQGAPGIEQAVASDPRMRELAPPPAPPPDLGGRILPAEQRQNPELLRQFRAGAPQGFAERAELASLPLMAFSPAALAGTVGGTALQQGAERAGAPVPVQVAAGVLGGIASGSPESIPAAFRLAGRGTVRLAQSSADLAAEMGRSNVGNALLPPAPQAVARPLIYDGFTPTERKILQSQGLRPSEIRRDIEGNRDLLYGPTDASGRRTGNIISAEDAAEIQRLEQEVGEAQMLRDFQAEQAGERRFLRTALPDSLADLHSRNLLARLEQSGADPTTFKFRGKGLDEVFQALPESEKASLARVDSTGREMNDVDRLLFGLDEIRRQGGTPGIRPRQEAIDRILSKYVTPDITEAPAATRLASQAGFGGEFGPREVTRANAEAAENFMRQAPLTEQAASEADRIAGARQPANLPQSSAQVAHAATQPPVPGQPAAQAAIPPPAQPPVQPPQPPIGGQPPPVGAGAGGVPPQAPIGGVAGGPPPEVARSLAQAAEMVRQDRPRAVSRAFDLLPPIRGLKNAFVPGRSMPDHLLGAHVAEGSARAELTQDFFASRRTIYDELDNAFGAGAKEGGQVNVPFRGTAAQAQNPITGTLKDIADNPELYDLNPAQQQALANMDLRNTALLNRVNQGYGTQIHQFPTKPGGAFLPNADASEDAMQAIEDFYGHPTGLRAVASGRNQERIFATARDRMAADPTFVPNTNVVELLRGLDQSKITAAADSVFDNGIGGLPQKPTGSAKAHGFKNLKTIGIDRWFPPDEAATILKLRDQRDVPAVFRLLSDWNATVLGGDFSPMTIQGGLQMLFHPRRTAQLIASGKAAFTPDSLARLVRSDPQGWRDFAFSTGRSITESTPQEFSTGLIGRIPKVGGAVSEGNDRMYNYVMSLLKNHFDDDVAELLKKGYSREQALTLAADLNQRIVPTINRTRLGLTSGGYQIRRAGFTSISFLIKPAELLNDATNGFMKIGIGQTRRVPGVGRFVTVQPTPREELAMRRVIKAAALIMPIAVTSQVIEAIRTGNDPAKAAQAAINTSSPTFGTLVVMGKKVPLGGPLRPLIMAISPQPVSGVPFPIPFAGASRYFQNRLTAGLTTPLTLYANVDRRGRRIVNRGKDNALVTAAKMTAYVAENILPVLPQGVASDARGGELGIDTAIEGVGQALGQNVSPSTTVTDLRRAWNKELNQYHAIPSNVREARSKKVQTREQFRIRNPEIDAKLFVTGQVDSLQTARARQLAVELMRKHGLSSKDLRVLDEKNFESPERTSLRRFFANALGENFKTTQNQVPVRPTQGPVFAP